MSEIKKYDVGSFHAQFTPKGNHSKGTLYITHRLHIPYVGQVYLSDSGSRKKYAEDAATQCQMNAEELAEVLNELATKRHEEAAYAIESGEEDDTNAASASTDSAILVSYAEGMELFHTPDQEAYATLQVRGHSETWAVSSRQVEMILRQRFYHDHRKAPSSQAVSDAIATLTARALFEGGEQNVYVRIAEYGDAVYMDLGDSDWGAIVVTPTGWSVVPDPPVKFVRSNNTGPLPRPESGGSLEDLRRFLNTDEDGFKLTVGWLVGSLNPSGPYPILEISGEQGTAKSTTARLLCKLVDPKAKVELRSLPSSERDLAIAAKASHLLALDNLSYVRPQMSDALCRLATGGGFGTRTLYTNDDEMLFDAMRPQILNGINPVALRGDLQERSISVELLPISKDERREEKKFWEEFEAVRPKIFGAILDAVSAVLRNIGEVHLDELPRMADFAVWVSAAEEALPWEAGEFIVAYSGNRRAATYEFLGSDPVAAAIKKLLTWSPSHEWQGTATELLEALNDQATEEIRRPTYWPKAPNSLSRTMTRIAPALREAGIEYGETETGHDKTKVKTLKQISAFSDVETDLTSEVAAMDNSDQEPDDDDFGFYPLDDE